MDVLFMISSQYVAQSVSFLLFALSMSAFAKFPSYSDICITPA